MRLPSFAFLRGRTSDQGVQRLWQKLTSIPLLLVLLAALAAGYLFFVGWSAFHFTTLQDSEFGVHFASIAWLAGGSMYPDEGSGDLYGLLYGPLTYLIYSFPYWLSGSIAMAKAFGITFFLVSIAIIWQITHSSSNSWRHRLALSIGAIALLFYMREFAFAPKADPVILLVAAVSVLAAIRRSGWALMALLAAILINLKLSAIVAIFPSVVLLWALRHPTRQELAGAAGVFFLAAVLPFLLLPDVSLTNYVSLLRDAKEHGIDFTLLLVNLSIVLMLAWVVFALGALSKFQNAWWALLVSALLLSFAGAKQMTGSYHLMPLIPVYIALIGVGIAAESSHSENLLSKVAVSLAGLAAITMVLPVQASAYFLVSNHSELKQSAVVKELSVLAKSYPGLLVDGGYLPSVEAVATTNGGQKHISYWALLDYSLAGHRLPLSVISSIKQCKFPYVATITGAKPFAAKYVIDGKNIEVYGQEFRDAFKASYVLHKNGGGVDIWRCKF